MRLRPSRWMPTVKTRIAFQLLRSCFKLSRPGAGYAASGHRCTQCSLIIACPVFQNLVAGMTVIQTSPAAKMDVVQDLVHLATLTPRALHATKVRGASVVSAFRYQNHSRARYSGIEDEDDCCSGCGQNDSDAHSLASKDDCRSGDVPRNRSECCQACPVGTVGLTAGTDGAYTETLTFRVFV